MTVSRRTLLLGAAACAAIAFGVVLGIAYVVPLGERLDASVLNHLMALPGRRGTALARFLAHTADPLPLAVMLVVIAAAGVLAGRWQAAVAGIAIVVASTATSEILKPVLAHPRLQAIGGQTATDIVAFPSGHATAAMSLALAAIVIVPKRFRALAAAVGLVYAAAVGGSLVALGWHFPSDVTGGYLVAAFWFALAVALLTVIESKGAWPASDSPAATTT